MVPDVKRRRSLRSRRRGVKRYPKRSNSAKIISVEIIFALFDLLGLRFTPRLRDIGSRRLYRSGAIDLHHYLRLQPHITGRINRQRVLDWWDEMLRAAGSMKLGHVTASLLVQK